MSEADRALADLAELFASPAMAELYGEEVSIRTHMLQCAERAVAEHQDDALIAAALLHDIGWAISGKDAAEAHPAIGADLLAPLLGPAVAEPVRLHVAAKRYLVATRGDYAALLSDISRHTLELQGGEMSADECAAFARELGFAAAVALRLIDDAGKELRAPNSEFDDYTGLLRGLIETNG